MISLILIFLGGVVMDLLHANYIRSLASGSVARAVVLSGTITGFSMLLWAEVLARTQSHGLAGIFALAVGAAVGTAVSLRKPRNQKIQ